MASDSLITGTAASNVVGRLPPPRAKAGWHHWKKVATSAWLRSTWSAALSQLLKHIPLACQETHICISWPPCLTVGTGASAAPMASAMDFVRTRCVKALLAVNQGSRVRLRTLRSVASSPSVRLWRGFLPCVCDPGPPMAEVSLDFPPPSLWCCSKASAGTCVTQGSQFNVLLSSKASRPLMRSGGACNPSVRQQNCLSNHFLCFNCHQ